MKKLFAVIVFAFAATLFTSCSKLYTCTCSVSGMGVSDSTLVISYHGVTHNTAINNCNNTQANGNTTGYVFSCHL